MDFDEIDWPFFGIVLLVFALIACGAYLDWRAEQNCVNHGGHEVVTGYYTTVTKRSVTVTPEYTCEGTH